MKKAVVFCLIMIFAVMVMIAPVFADTEQADDSSTQDQSVQVPDGYYIPGDLTDPDNPDYDPSLCGGGGSGTEPTGDEGGWGDVGN